MTPILFCADVFDSSCPHPMWEEEVKIATKIGEIYLLDHEELTNGKVAKALRRLPDATTQDYTKIIYHGWMLTPETYYHLYNGLKNKGFQLINDIEDYSGCHYISNWYNVIKEFTPKTKTVPFIDVEFVVNAIGEFGSSPVFIKDYVKSQKHSWKEACFIPTANDVEAVKKVVSNFIELQKEYGGVQGGIVFREFIPLRSIGIHPKSGMPLSQEFRAFVLHGKVISLSQYWEYGNYFEDTPPITLRDELQILINKYLGEDKYTEDGLLAHYLVDILKNYDIMFTIAQDFYDLEVKE